VNFWRRVYTEITTREGFVHDDQHLNIVYETVRLSNAGDRAHRASAVDADERYVRALRAVAGGKRDNLSKAEARVVELWGPNLDKSTLLAASQRVRFQLGQADRFREGLIRSGAWEDYVRKTMRMQDCRRNCRLAAR
jgi:membrane-bound lytic murein transglycosylase D